MANTLDLAIKRGTTFGPGLITVKDTATGLPVPLAGYTAHAHARADENAALYLDLAPVIAADDAAGLITLPALTPAQTAALAPSPGAGICCWKTPPASS
jgi:hypothetical protein